MFKAAPFTITKTWNQSRYPSVDERAKKIWCVYTRDYYSDIQKSEIMLFVRK
jgi:hypothetical protein